jgi:predicted NAD-dependent protein-ADP-ribosyltransferase YbiA (DUF1768 family)
MRLPRLTKELFSRRVSTLFRRQRLWTWQNAVALPLSPRLFRPSAQALKLAATANAELVEGNRHRDRFWGVWGDKGQNWLGRILMEVRAELANDPGAST